MWPNLELLAVDVHPCYGRYLPLQLRNFLAHRSGVLPPSFKLALPHSAAAAWRDEDAISWSAIVESGYHHQSLPRQLVSDISRSFKADGIFGERDYHFEGITAAEGQEIS